jgi:hypothetical protein
MPDDKIVIENINSPGRAEQVNRGTIGAMRDAPPAVPQHAAPGLKLPETKPTLLLRLPNALYPAGDKVGWWMTAVEPKGTVRHALSEPLQLHRPTSAT